MNILVSAGAGSGKTTVLTKRVINLLKNVGYKFENMIILTFTDLAAKEMKDRIIEALSSEEDDRLKEELKHIDEAHIQTFDSFCHDFVTKYSCYSKIPSSFDIGDAPLFEMVAHRALKEILSPYFRDENENFNYILSSK